MSAETGIGNVLPAMQSPSTSVQITPGRGWTRFTYARVDMALLGVVQIGLQIGALAQLPGGEYAQVNGDFIELLDSAQVVAALQRAGLPARTAPAASRPATVTIKKRRHVAMPTGA